MKVDFHKINCNPCLKGVHKFVTCKHKLHVNYDDHHTDRLVTYVATWQALVDSPKQCISVYQNEMTPVKDETLMSFCEAAQCAQFPLIFVRKNLVIFPDITKFLLPKVEAKCYNYDRFDC